MTIDLTTTICAPATAFGQGAVGIVRLSGPKSWAIASVLCPQVQLQAKGMYYGWLLDPNDQAPIDDVVLLAFKAPKSLTGDDVIEIQCHGGVALVEKVVALCVAQGAVLAMPGEFSHRAVLNGKMNLSQAESVLDLIQAEGEALIKAAAKNIQTKSIQTWIGQLQQVITTIQADMVAAIDFPDEVDEPAKQTLLEALAAIIETAELALSQCQRQQVLRDGLNIAILGQPNAGKSSLFNALLNQQRAIVTPIAGTTRDILRERLVISGVPITVLDTAGLRESTTDAIEKIGIENSKSAAQTAELIVFVVDATCPNTTDTSLLEEVASHSPDGVIVLNKQDLVSTAVQLDIPSNALHWPVIACSTQNNQGLVALEQALSSAISQRTQALTLPFVLSHRQLALLQQVLENLHQAQATLKTMPLDLVTVPITDALLCLQSMVGGDMVESVLDSVFARFCVGK